MTKPTAWEQYFELAKTGAVHALVGKEYLLDLQSLAAAEIRADERAQLAAGDAEDVAGWLRLSLNAAGLAASHSDDVAEKLTNLIGAFMALKTRETRTDERARIVATLARMARDAHSVGRETKAEALTVAASVIKRGVQS